MEKEILGSLELNRIYQMDCLEGMKLIPKGSIDMILCDLPYGTTACSWDAIIPFDLLWDQYLRVIKDDAAIVLFSTQPFTTKLIDSNLPLFKYTWVWEKSKAGGIFNAKNRPLKYHEDICVFSKSPAANIKGVKMKYFPQDLLVIDEERKNKQRNGDETIGNRPSRKGGYKQTATGYPKSILKHNNETGYHPTQKPVSLCEYLIRTYTKPNEIVLDNCIGSGTTAVASLKSGRKFIGFETDRKYIETANVRIDSDADTYRTDIDELLAVLDKGEF